MEYSASQQFLLAQQLGQKLGLRNRAHASGRGVGLLGKKQALELALAALALALAIGQRKRLLGWGKRHSGTSAPRTDRAVLRIYQGLLERLGSAGAPRRRSETPHEYLARMREAGIEGADELGRLTEAYASVRYGDVELASDQIAELRRTASLIRLPG
jgi:hypothetical protein